MMPAISKGAKALTKHELIQKMATDAKISKAAAGTVLNSFVRHVTLSLSKGKPFTLTGFGTWKVTRRKARLGRNPQTGAELKIPEQQLALPLHALCERGIAEKKANGKLELTPAGVAMRDRIVAARRKGLADMLARWRPEEHPDVLALIERMAQALTSDLPAPQAA